MDLRVAAGDVGKGGAMAKSVYVPGHQQDVFISYAHVDNDADVDGDGGWVANFERLLCKRLKQLLGGDCFSIWRDPELAKNIQFDAQIVRSLEQTATLLVVLSPGYLASPWCEREMRTFLKMLQERASSGGRVFVVQREKIDFHDWPPEFERLLGYRFWTEAEGKRPRPLHWQRDQPEYYDALNDLANELADELKRLRQSALAGEAAADANDRTAAADESKTTIFLAETTDDIDPVRSKVRRHLEQQTGLRVVPSGWYRRDPAAFMQAVREDLAEAKLFVQLLSPVTGRQMPGFDETYVAFQHRAALDQNLPILQWRDPAVQPATVEAVVEDPVHRRMLLGATVQAVDIEDFSRDVVTQATRKPRSYDRPSADILVFVNTSSDDCPLAADLCRYLDQRGFGYSIPIHEGKPEEIREDLRENVLTCDGMIVVYGLCASNWVRGQLMEARKASTQRHRRLHAAVYEGPPTPKSPLGFKLARMHVIPCHEGLDEQSLQPFLDELRSSLEEQNATAPVALVGVP